MADRSSAAGACEPAALLRWARGTGLVADARDERRLEAMRLPVLAAGALPDGSTADVELTAQWAAFICWVDDRIDRRGLGSAPGELERFTAPLRQVLVPGAPAAKAPQAVLLAGLWERTAPGMPERWQKRFATDYGDFLDASEQEAALRRAGARLPPTDYVELRRRTITLLPMLNVLERTGHAHLVEDPRVDTDLRDLRRALADIAGWANDLASHEQDSAASQHNLVSLIARRDNCPTAEAQMRVAAMIDQRRADFHATATALRTTSDLPTHTLRELHAYVDLVETFMAATLHWLASTGRFATDPEPPPGIQDPAPPDTLRADAARRLREGGGADGLA
ncbi:terpene synthase family protein [Kitasatospora sp. GAS204B]|uniref:terpene synthase family protein n=1 Tax=unclassified Kitasatospora TaxID=2633591 RepID=UPI00247585DF|nr:terpene synthase family protein [Kitasatospora sp. GAS204B]MDH6122328.1 hypothetical protein [Kitasatospora sp. GAS204B]